MDDRVCDPNLCSRLIVKIVLGSFTFFKLRVQRMHTSSTAESRKNISKLYGRVRGNVSGKDFDNAASRLTTKDSTMQATSPLVEHTRVAGRQRAGTWGRMVKPDDEAVTTAWDYLAPSSSDGEDEKGSFLFLSKSVLSSPLPLCLRRDGRSMMKRVEQVAYEHPSHPPPPPFPLE